MGFLSLIKTKKSAILTPTKKYLTYPADATKEETYSTHIPYSDVNWKYPQEERIQDSENIVHIDENDDDIDITSFPLNTMKDNEYS